MLLLGFDLLLGFAFYDAFCWGFSIVLGSFNCCSYQRPKLWLAVMFWFLGLICFRGFLSVIQVCTGSSGNKVLFLVIFWIGLILGISLFDEWDDIYWLKNQSEHVHYTAIKCLKKQNCSKQNPLNWIHQKQINNQTKKICSTVYNLKLYQYKTEISALYLLIVPFLQAYFLEIPILCIMLHYQPIF